MAESPAACCFLDSFSVVLAAAATPSVSFRMFQALASSSLIPSSSSLEDAHSSWLTSVWPKKHIPVCSQLLRQMVPLASLNVLDRHLPSHWVWAVAQQTVSMRWRGLSQRPYIGHTWFLPDLHHPQVAGIPHRLLSWASGESPLMVLLFYIVCRLFSLLKPLDDGWVCGWAVGFGDQPQFKLIHLAGVIEYAEIACIM